MHHLTKFILTLFLILPFISGCESDKTSKNIAINQDSLKKIKIVRLRSDSLEIQKRKNQDSLNLKYENIAFADIKFGWNKNQVENSIKRFIEKNNAHWEYAKKGKPHFLIGGYRGKELKGYYYNDKLYKLRIYGGEHLGTGFTRHTPIERKYRDSDIVKELERILKEKYGEPHEKGRIDQSVRFGYLNIVRRWVIGDKVISIVHYRESAKRYIDVIIYLKSISNQVEAKKIKENVKKTNKIGETKNTF